MAYMRDYRGSRIDAVDLLRDFPNLIGWWDFSEATQLTDGAGIARVRDQSGLGQDLMQGTVARRPTKQTGEDGQAVGRFSVAPQLLTAGNFGGAFPVADGYAAPVTFAMIMRSSTTGTGYGVPVGCSGTGNTARLIVDFDNTKCAAAFNSAATGYHGAMIADGLWHVVVVTCDRGGAAVYVDGNLTSMSGSSVGTVGAQTLGVGALQNLSNQWFGDMRMIVALNGRLRFDQVTALTEWLAERTPVAPTLGLCDAPVGWDQTVDANGQNVRIFTPAAPSTPRTLVLWAHQAGGDEKIAPGFFGYLLAHAAMANGWYFASSAQHGDPWGNAQGLADMVALKAFADTRDTFTKVILVGASMGGLSVAQLVSGNMIANTVGAYFIDAALSLSAMYANATYTPQIDVPFGITRGTLSAASASGATSIATTSSFPTVGTQLLIGNGTANVETVVTTAPSTGTSVAVTATTKAHASGEQVSDYPTKTAGRDPMLKPANTYAKRLRFTAATADTNVVKSTNTDAFRTLVAATAVESGLVSRPSTHLTGAAANPADFVAFVKRCIAA